MTIKVPVPRMILAFVYLSNGIESKESPRMIDPNLFDYRGIRETSDGDCLPIYQQRDSNEI